MVAVILIIIVAFILLVNIQYKIINEKANLLVKLQAEITQKIRLLHLQGTPVDEIISKLNLELVPYNLTVNEQYVLDVIERKVQ